MKILKTPLFIYLFGGTLIAIANNVNNNIASVVLQVVGIVLVLLGIVSYFKR